MQEIGENDRKLENYWETETCEFFAAAKTKKNIRNWEFVNFYPKLGLKCQQKLQEVGQNDRK